jgi:tetratricopeptide (TPR) repeat protein
VSEEPSLVARARLRMSSWLFLWAGLLRSAGSRPAQAEELYRLSLERHPGSPTAWMMLGEALESQHRWEEAAEAYTSLAVLDATHSNAFYHRATCWMALGRLEEAIADCGEAIRPDARHFAAELVLGQALSRAGRHPEALEAFRAAVCLKPRDPDAVRLLVTEEAHVGDAP